MIILTGFVNYINPESVIPTEQLNSELVYPIVANDNRANASRPEGFFRWPGHKTEKQ